MKTSVTIQRRLTIVTSGYDDRFLASESTYTLRYSGVSGLPVEVHFHDERDTLSFLTDGLGVDSGAAYDIVNSAEITRRMSGYITPRHWQSTPVSVSDLESIKVLLDLRTPDRFLPEYVEELRARLAARPVEGNLLAIVNYQLDECDRMNTWKWGAPNGRAA